LITGKYVVNSVQGSTKTMASISCAADGKTMIQFTGIDGRRRTIRLGHISQRMAEFTKARIESLLSSSLVGCSPDPEVSRWLASLGDVMLNKLAAVGLIPKRQVVTLKNFIDGYIQSRIDVKSGTRESYVHVRNNLIEYFGENKILRDILMNPLAHREQAFPFSYLV